MSYQIDWYDPEKTVIYARYGHEVDYNDLYALFDDCVTMLDTIQHSAVFINDLVDLKVVHKINLTALRKVAQHPVILHPRRIHSYFINVGGKSRLVLDVGLRLFPRMMERVSTATTIQEVLKKTEAVRQLRTG